MESVLANQAPAKLSRGRKYAIYFTILVQCIVKMQSFVKQLKALRTAIRKQRADVSNFVPDPKEVFANYVKVFSNISGVPDSEMSIFLKEYIKDHLKKSLNKQDLELPQEKIEEIVYESHQKTLTVEGAQILFAGKQRLDRSIKEKDRDAGRALFQSRESAMIDVFVKELDQIISEIAGITGYSKDEYSYSQYALMIAIIDEL